MCLIIYQTKRIKMTKKEPQKTDVDGNEIFRYDLFGKENVSLLFFNTFGKGLMLLGLVAVVGYLGGLLGTFADKSNDLYKSVSVVNDMYEEDGKDHSVEEREHTKVLNGTNKSLLIESDREFHLNDLNLLPFYEIKATSKDPIVCQILKDGECEKE